MFVVVFFFLFCIAILYCGILIFALCKGGFVAETTWQSLSLKKTGYKEYVYFTLGVLLFICASLAGLDTVWPAAGVVLSFIAGICDDMLRQYVTEVPDGVY